LRAGDVYRALWRHKFFIVLLTAVFVGATWYVASRETREYEASTLVRVQERGPRSGDAGAALQAAQTLAQTYAKLISSGALEDEIDALLTQCARRAPDSGRRDGSARPRSCTSLGSSSRLGPRSVSGVRLTASPVEELDLLSITGRSENATSATVAANAAPLALRTFIRRTGARSEQIVIAKQAQTPSSPVSQQLLLKIAIALMLGLIFNGALALLIDVFRDRLPDPDELGPAVGHPVLATIPTLRLYPVRALAGPEAEQEPVLTVPGSPGGEADSPMNPRNGPRA
jgi:capsular polysaccharide biosynthesis protein